MNEIFTNLLDEKFKRYLGNAWLVHDWDFYGADFGLVIRLKDNVWSLLTFKESGYADTETLIERLSTEQLTNFIDCLSPTNNKFKTQRKQEL